MNVLVGVLRLEVEQLGHHQVGALVLERADQENNPLLEQTGVDVVGTLAPGRRLDHRRHVIQRPDGVIWLAALEIHHGCRYAPRLSCSPRHSQKRLCARRLARLTRGVYLVNNSPTGV